jgi:hypothetical protein
MKNTARTVLALTTACVIALGYCLFNLKHLGRSIGYDEVVYFFWVDNWDSHQVYYPHHLLFVPTSVLFQRSFTQLTGITNTAFIQRFKNILSVSLGLGLFFLIFYAHSRRFWLSLTIALLIGISGSLWHDAHHHETSAIPGVLINLTMLLLLFYRKFPYPIVFIALFSLFNAFAILLHQVYLFSIIPVFLVLFFTKPQKDKKFYTLKNLFRSSLYLFLVFSMVGGTYYYIGFVKLNLRLKDNPRGYQTYMDLPIRGNFIKYFYLIKAHGKWGKKHPSWLKHGINGYISSFTTSFRTKYVNTRDFFNESHFPSNTALLAIGTFLSGFILFFIPVFRRYGTLYPALLLWFVIGSIFIFWWEPWYIEHWIYITILTWVLIFMVCNALLDSIKQNVPRIATYVLLCLLLFSFGSVLYRENLTHMILVQKKLFLPSNAYGRFWKEDYKMDAIYKKPL